MRGTQSRGLRWLAAAVVAAALFSAPTARAVGEADEDIFVHHGEAQEEADFSEGAEASDEGSGEEGEGGDETEDHAAAARFTCSLGVIVVVASMIIKELQSQRESFKASRPITYQMVEATIEECVACGAIAMIFIILRKNAVIDVLAVIARLPYVHVKEVEVVDEAVELIDAMVFWTFFYYFCLVFVCVFFVKLGQSSWEDEEEIAHTKSTPADSTFQRLRYAFFNPMVPGAGVKVASECTEFDVANVNFAKYFERAAAGCMCEVIHLPKVVILLPLLTFVTIFAVHSVTGTLEGRVAQVADMYVAAGCSWALLLLALFLRFDIRRMYKQVLPREPKGTAPFVAAAIEDLRRNFEASMTFDVVRVASDSSQMQRLAARAYWTQKSGSLQLEAAQERRPNKGAPARRPAMHVQDMQHNLFWFGSYKLGPWVLKTIIQGLLFGMCVMAAVCQRTFSGALFRANTHAFLLLYLPFPAILLCVCSSIMEYVVVTKLEIMVEEEIIDEVIAETKVGRFVPFVGTRTGKSLVQQMKYEAVMEKYRRMTESEVQASIASPEKLEAYDSLPEMEKAMLEVIFNRHDRDASGAIDRSELQACLEEEGFSIRTAERVTSDWMVIYDTDHSGYLSYEEFKMLHTVLLQEIKSTDVKPTDCIAMCRRLDKNGNGKMSADELSEAFQEWLGTVMPPAEIKAIFRTLCADSAESRDLDGGEVELELRRIAEWIYRVYEMTKSVQNSQDVMMGRAPSKRNTFAAENLP